MRKIDEDFFPQQDQKKAYKMITSRKITMVWKFIYWPIVWFVVFIPALFLPVSLHGIPKITSMLAGIILFAISMLLTSSGGRTLAQFGHQKAHETIWPDKFTEFGIFSCMRHPMHLGLAIFPIALALMSCSVTAILSSGWGVAGALWFVLYIEERDALSKYGRVYSDYMQRVPPFSIKIECFKKALMIWKNKGASAIE